MRGMGVPSDYPGRIRRLRKALQLRQPEFAAAIGVSSVSVSRWENGQHDPSDLAWKLIEELEARTNPSRAWSSTAIDFGADPSALASVVEAVRLRSGHMSSPTFATEISLIDPLPHQRVAVYEHILKHHPIRFLLADDAGAGKTIMSGLAIRELLSRRLAQRVLIVPPAGLVGNWQRELRTLFRIEAVIVRGADCAKSNPFLEPGGDFAICSVDTLRSRQPFARLREAGLNGAPYDLVIMDEGHKLAADIDTDGVTIRKTTRYKLGEGLAGIVGGEFDLGWAPQSFLMLTATPHMGKEYPYFALWRLLEPDIFTTPEMLKAVPKDRRARHFIRRTKEEMVKLDGTPLYPKRACDTLGFDLTADEQRLYDETSAYIRDVYNKAHTLNRSAAKLAMSVFQRRLVSSTYALKRSFDRRIEKLQAAIDQIVAGNSEEVFRRQAELRKKAENAELDLLETTTADEEGDEDGEIHEAGEAEALGATVTEALADLIVERDHVVSLRRLAEDLLDRGEESKFARLRETMEDPRFAGEKMLIFTEHRDTAEYLRSRLEALGSTGQVAQLHGGMDYAERDSQVEFFRKPISEGGARFLVATDAAGEGVNLQFCWLMVNYDVPWNPARLEQRMGRIHRYGQRKDVVYIANLVAPKTREGRVLKTLLDKLETIRKSLGSDKVFDVIGRLFENVSLKSYFDAAIIGEDASARLEGALTEDQVRAFQAQEQAIYGEDGAVRSLLPRLREDIEKERYLKLMPGYVQRLVDRSAPLLGIGLDGDISNGFRLLPLKAGALDAVAAEIEGYPPDMRERLSVKRPAPDEKAIWLHPGEPVFEAYAGEILERFESESRRGAVFIDPEAKEASLFHVASVRIVRRGERRDTTVDHRLVGIRQSASGVIEERPLEWLLLLRGADDVAPGAYAAARDCPRLTASAETWLRDDFGANLLRARRDDVSRDLPDRLELVRRGFTRQEADLLRARNRLRAAANDGRKQAAEQLELVKDRQSRLAGERDRRLADIAGEPARIELGAVEFLAHALVVPPLDDQEAVRFAIEVDQIAMRLATAHEEHDGAVVRDVSKVAGARSAGLSDYPGFDLLSDHASRGRRCIEVKGRADRGDVFMTENEWAKAANLREQYWLYVVLNCGSPSPELFRIRDPFHKLTGVAKGGFSFKLGDIREMAEAD